MNLQELQATLREIKEQISGIDSDIRRTEKEIAKLDGKLGDLEEKKEKKVKLRTVLAELKETWKQGQLKDDKLHEPYYTFLIRKGGEFSPAFPEEWGKHSGISSEIAIVPMEKLIRRKCPGCGRSSLLIRRCEIVYAETPKGDTQVEEEEFLIICCGEARRLGIIPGQSKVAPW